MLYDLDNLVAKRSNVFGTFGIFLGIWLRKTKTLVVSIALALQARLKIVVIISAATELARNTLASATRSRKCSRCRCRRPNLDGWDL